MKSYEHFPHESDVGLRGVGATPKEAFEELGLALTAVVSDPAAVLARERIEIECHAPDLEFLAYEWLNAIIYEMDRRKMLFSSFEIEFVSETGLRAVIGGEAIDRARHRPAVEIKGATMTELKVFQKDRDWIAQCVVDV